MTSVTLRRWTQAVRSLNRWADSLNQENPRLLPASLSIAGGWFLGLVLKRGWVPHYLQNLATLSVVFAIFSVSDHLAHESDLLAVTLMGMWLANKKDLHINEILNFKENLSVVLISGLFILLAARLTLDDILALGWPPCFCCW